MIDLLVIQYFTGLGWVDGEKKGCVCVCVCVCMAGGGGGGGVMV